MKTVMIADPDPTVRKALTLLLQRRFGMDDICESGDMLSFAICMADCSPELLLFDPALCNAPALEACLLLRQNYPTPKLILLSANAEDAAAAQRAGVCFIHKGGDPEKLITTLTSLLKE